LIFAFLLLLLIWAHQIIEHGFVPLLEVFKVLITLAFLFCTEVIFLLATIFISFLDSLFGFEITLRMLSESVVKEFPV
jgi:hypothetical protein